MATAGAPQCTNDYFVLVERVIQMAIDLMEVQAAKASNTSLFVSCAHSGEKCESSERGFQIGRNELRLNPIFKPLSFLTLKVPLSGGRQPDADVPSTQSKFSENLFRIDESAGRRVSFRLAERLIQCRSVGFIEPIARIHWKDLYFNPVYQCLGTVRNAG